MIEPQMILFEQIRNLVEQAQGRTARAVNQTMVETYWHIGREGSKGQISTFNKVSL
ncbi:MAG: hypothetical protein ABII96_07735 [Candidatus Zixiibacteriota bacterium]